MKYYHPKFDLEKAFQPVHLEEAQAFRYKAFGVANETGLECDEYDKKFNEIQARNEEFTDAEQKTWDNKERFDEITKKYCKVNPNTKLIECKFGMFSGEDKKFYNTHKENMKTLLEKQKNIKQD